MSSSTTRHDALKGRGSDKSVESGVLHLIDKVSSVHYLDRYLTDYCRTTHTVVLLQEAVYVAAQLQEFAGMQSRSNCQLYLLREDLLARGLGDCWLSGEGAEKKDRPQRYISIDYEDLVDLTVNYSTIRSVSLD